MKKKLLLTLSLLCGIGISVVGCGGGNTGNSSQPESSSEASEVCSTTEDDKVHLILLAGQSGGRGKALNTDLLEEEAEPNTDVDIAADGLMMGDLGRIPEVIDDIPLIEVQPGLGDTSTEFGPELGMAQTMASRYPKNGETRKSAIVKYTACGSTFIADWYTKSLTESNNHSESLDYTQGRVDEDGNVWGPLTYNFFQLIDQTIASLESEGYEVVIDGCVFIHGEQDTKFDANMALYEEALEYFVTDVREYVGDEDLPFVITEALTNSGMYCNELRAIQKRVTDKLDNCSLVTNEGLTTNTFEPWHFGKDGNFKLGNRVAAEIISYNDTRKVSSFEEQTIKVPLNADVTLPKYATATFENGYTGLTKVEYTDTYDKTIKGTYNVSYKASGCQDVTGTLVVEVTDEVYVDGIMNEYEGRKALSLGDLGDIYVTKGEEGLYVSAKINDKEIWADGESWHNGDMGQSGVNDDFRVFLTTSDAQSRHSILLSSANLLRVYGDGAGYTNPNDNWVYQGYLEEHYYRVTTKGIVNDSEVESGGLEIELYIPYFNFNVEADDIKLCFNYYDVAMVDGRRVATNNYYTASGVSQEANLENNDASYISISELI